MKKISFIIVLFFCFSNNLKSQSINKREFRRISLDIDFGVPLFYGDIKNKFSAAFGMKTNFHLTSALSLNADFTFINLKGAGSPLLNSFNNNAFRVLVGGEIYLFNILRLNKISNFFQPFAGISIGGIKNSFTKSVINDAEVDIKNEDWHFTYQYTGGFKIYIIKNLDLNLKVKLNFTKTDLLDNYKPNVPANKKNDAFVTFAAGITYHFGKKNKDPIIWNTTENYMFFLPKNSSFQNRTNSKNDSSNNRKKEPKKTSTEDPIYKNPTIEKYIDVDENEFDCIIKF